MSTRNLKVGYRLTRNATPTADKAPYLGVAVPVGSLAYDNILAKMIDSGTFMSRATAQYFLNAFYEFAAEEIAANVVRLNTGAVSIYPMIGGAFDSEDDTFKEPRNTLYIGATLSQDIRNAVAGIVPDYLGDEAAAGSVKINSVFDLATMTNGVIDGTNDFRICGIDLTVPDGDDESLTFVRKDGVTKVADITVSETEDGQRITCHLSGNTEAIPKGTYKMRLVSHGLDPTAPLSVVTKTVTLTEAVPVPVPTVTNVTFDGTPFEEAESIPASGSTVDADNWSRTPDDRLVVTYPDEAGGTHVIDKALEDGGGGSGYTSDLRSEMEAKEIPLDAEVELKLVLHGGVEGSPDQVFTTQLALAR